MTKRKRRPYRTTRRYPTRKKTTTKEGRRDYMRLYMRDILGIDPSRFGKPGRKPKKKKKTLGLDLEI